MLRSEFRTTYHQLTHGDFRELILAAKFVKQRRLSTLLSRVIWLSVLPLIVLTIALVIFDIYQQQERLHGQADRLARNVSVSVESYLDSRIKALDMLAGSSIVDEPARWSELYAAALVFLSRFDNHVIFANNDQPVRMLFNTRLPFGSELPNVPVPTGRAAVPIALSTGRPAVGDTFTGPIANELLVAIVVPIVRSGHVQNLLLSTLAATQFQENLESVALPTGWAVTLRDHSGEVIATRSPPGFDAVRDVSPSERFELGVDTAGWLVTVEIPRAIYWADLFRLASVLVLAAMLSIAAAWLGGSASGRTIARQVAALANTSNLDDMDVDIQEIAAVKQRLEVDAFESRGSEARHRQLFEDNPLAMWVYDLATLQFIAVNDAAIKQYGYSRDTFLSMTIKDIRPPEDVPRLLENIASVQNGLDEAGHWQHLTQDGRLIHVEIKSHVITFDGKRCELVLANNISERIRVETQLAHLSQHDALTDLPNRTLLKDRLTVALFYKQQVKSHLSILCIYIDRLKSINDAFGHDFGDKALCQVADRLKLCIKNTDTLSRVGADEFLILLPDTLDREGAAQISSNILISLITPLQIDEKSIVLNSNIGIACYPEHGEEPEILLRNAANAAHTARDLGPNHFEFHTAEINDRAAARITLENELYQALKLNQLFLLYQPQINFSSGKLSGIEALIRWQHPVHGLISPAQFIPIAEESGQITSIGRWVLDTAAHQHASWVTRFKLDVPMAVNVSAIQFRQTGFLDTVWEILHKSQLSPDFLELELTESVVMQNLSDVMTKLDRLADSGVKLAIDDFGTGYSSLSYLKQFPLYRLKIDQSFVKNLPKDNQSNAIAEAIIQLGHSLGLTVLAEGVETLAQRDCLDQLGCDDGQGYLFARPMGATEFEDYMDKVKLTHPLGWLSPQVRGTHLE